VKGGTVEKLVERLTYFKYPGSLVAHSFLATLSTLLKSFSTRPRIPPRLPSYLPVIHNPRAALPLPCQEVAFSFLFLFFFFSSNQTLLFPKFPILVRYEEEIPPGLNEREFKIYSEKKIKPTRLR